MDKAETIFLKYAGFKINPELGAAATYAGGAALGAGTLVGGLGIVAAGKKSKDRGERYAGKTMAKTVIPTTAIGGALGAGAGAGFLQAINRLSHEKPFTKIDKLRAGGRLGAAGAITGLIASTAAYSGGRLFGKDKKKKKK
jgi:hypothetical protein